MISSPDKSYKLRYAYGPYFGAGRRWLRSRSIWNTAPGVRHHPKGCRHTAPDIQHLTVRGLSQHCQQRQRIGSPSSMDPPWSAFGSHNLPDERPTMLDAPSACLISFDLGWFLAGSSKRTADPCVIAALGPCCQFLRAESRDTVASSPVWSASH